MNVKKFYEDINGNYSSALSIMMNDALIERMLAKFMNDNAYNDIIAAYNNNDLERVFVLVHTIKGVTGNLALTPLYELACIITEATRNNPNADIKEEIKKLEEAYSLVASCYQNNAWKSWLTLI